MLTIKHLIKSYVEESNFVEQHKHTRQNKDLTFDDFMGMFGAYTDASTIGPGDADRFVQYYKEEKKLSDSSAMTKASYLSAVWNFAVEKELVNRNPFVGLYRRVKEKYGISDPRYPGTNRAAGEPKEKKKEEEKPRLDPRKWLAEKLGSGIVSVNDLKKLAIQEGINWWAVETAKNYLHVKSKHKGFGPMGHWEWHLPQAALLKSAPKAPAPKPARVRSEGAGAEVYERWATWTEEELMRFLAEASFPCAFAAALTRYSGQRYTDVINLKWSQIGKTHIHFRQRKTGNHLEVPIHSRLKDWLMWAQAQIAKKIELGLLKENPEYVLLDEKGREMAKLSNRTFAHMFRKEYKRVFNTDKVKGLHGLRKLMAVSLIERGAGDRQVMSITGHLHRSSLKAYFAAAKQKKLAEEAMKLLETKEDDDDHE